MCELKNEAGNASLDTFLKEQSFKVSGSIASEEAFTLEVEM